MRGGLAAALAVVAFGATAQADPRFTVTWHPLATLVRSWQFEFEAAPWRWVSLHATPSMVFTIDNGAPRPLAFAMDVGARAFPFGRAPHGFFVGVHAGAATWNVAGFEPAASGRGLRGGLGVGYTFIWWQRVVLSAGGGVEYAHFVAPSQPDNGYGRAWPYVRLALGVAF